MTNPPMHARGIRNFGDEMVVPEGESLNTLLETLADWERQLKDCEDVIPYDLGNKSDGPSP